MKKKLPISLIMIVLMICTVYTSNAQQKSIRYEAGRKTLRSQQIERIDSLLKIDTIKSAGKVDSLIIRRTLSKRDSTITIEDNATLVKRDSTIKVDYLKIDTTFLGATTKLPSREELKLDPIDPKLHRRSFLQDTIKAGRVALMSFIPGLGQAYNRQFLKIPVIYGVMGGFIVGGINSSSKYNNYRKEWQRTVNLNLPQSQQDKAFGKMNNEGTIRTLYYSAAVATYLYQMADATFNYRGPTDHIRKATTLAMAFPGAGFIYTRTYWRLPVYYGGGALLASVVDYNNRYYQRYLTAYNALTDGDPTTQVDLSLSRYSEAQLKNARDSHRRNRDLGIISLVGVYILSVIDTHVIATLKNWDISPDLSVTIQPTIINNSIPRVSNVPSGNGLTLKIRF